MKKIESLENKISLLKPILSEFIIHKDEILTRWVTMDETKTLLIRYDISPEQFKKDFGSDIYDYFMGIIAGKKNFGQCPAISNLIDFLQSKNLRSEEIFHLCSNLKVSVFESIVDKENESAQIPVAISVLFDSNLGGVLKQYATTSYANEQQAVDASLAREHFLSSMSHEIRTPLNAILGFVSLLKDDPISQKQQKYLDIISSSGENLLRIINDILDFSKLRSGEFTIEKTSFNIYDALTEVLELFVPLAVQKNVLLKSFISPSVEYELFGDGDRIKQIVSNLLSNAIKFSTGDGSYVDVEAKYENGTLFIEVKDNGIGIDKEDLDYIFNPFSQVKENWKDYYGGTGLGLPICKQLAQLMGGKISVRSKLKKGSTFVVELPLEINQKERVFVFDRLRYAPIRFGFLRHDEKESFKVESLGRYMEYYNMSVTPLETIDDAEYDILVFMANSIDDTLEKTIIERNIPSIAILDFFEPRYADVKNITPLAFPIYCNKIKYAVDRAMGWLDAPEIKPSGKSIICYKGRVLIVEDNQANQELLRFMLEKYHIDSTIVSNGLEAYNLIAYKKERFDMILMDQQMPVMNGDEATRIIKTFEDEHKLKHTPVIAITANVIQCSKEKVTQNGYDGFLGKPIAAKEIEAVFAQYLKAESDISLPQAQEEPIMSININEEKWNIDYDAIESILLLDREQIVYLLSVYCEKVEGLMKGLDESIKKRSYQKIAFLAHEIKGSSSNFRFEEIFLKAQEIESRAKKKDKSFDYANAIRGLYGEFEKLFGKTCVSMV